MNELKKVIDTLDEAADSFDGIATKEQKKIYDEVITLAKDLDTDASGRVRQSIANLKRLTLIKAKLAALSKDKEWVAGIGKFLQYFGTLQKEQNAYYSAHFSQETLSKTAKEKNELLRQLAVQNTVEALMGDGLKANVTDKLNDILLRAVTTNAKFADLQEELRAHLLGQNGGQGAFARYATTYATTALSQFTGQNNKLMTDDLDTEWYMYVGSNKETTREFCEQLTKKKYIHKSEIPTILTGLIDEYQCAIYERTGLPYGMIAGTTPDNFQCNCGGWNCRHQLVPVADAVVPKPIRDRLRNRLNGVPEPAPQKTEYDTWMEGHGLAVKFAKDYARWFAVDASALDNRNASAAELDEALKQINKEVKRRLRTDDSTEIATYLMKQGYKDIKINDDGGLFARDPKHAKHPKDTKVYFTDENGQNGLKGDDLEAECASEIFNMGERVILRGEGITDASGNQMREIDAIVNGELMDIASITEHNAHTIRNIFNKKNRQLSEFNEQHNMEARSLCLYFHDPSWFSEQEIRDQYADHLAYHPDGSSIKYVYVVLRGNDHIIRIKLA